ncbi:MAG TPA: SLBB domain-containing protein [Caulobacteraceae bacterium]|jgi:protein involved in polysaccharide export with SLBB domain
MCLALAAPASSQTYSGMGQQPTNTNPYLNQYPSANGTGATNPDSLSPSDQQFPGSTQSQSTGQGQLNNQGGFTPFTLPSVAPESAQTLSPLNGTPGATATPQPLYARPGSQPGQFELFTRPPPQPGEFEAFVKEKLGRELPRFGANLILEGSKGFAQPSNATLPPDYRLNPGDELLIGVTGSVEASLRLTIDDDGRIFIPRVGAVSVAGIRYGDLQAALTRRFEEQFKAVTLSVVISRLHGLTVYVTGYAVSPGAYTVSSVSTMVDAVLAAGGPAAGGSFRNIELRRNGQVVSQLDLYDLLLNGDKSHDAVLQNEDVLNIAPAGPEVAVTGSVNSEAIFEAKPGETLGDMIRYAGGFNSLADPSRVIVQRLADLDKAGSQQLPWDRAVAFPAEGGDIVRILSLGQIARPEERQAILATIEGEVDRPGRYYLRPGATLGDLLTAAGGLSTGAFVYGSDLTRASVQRQQEKSYGHAITELEFAAATAPLTALGATDAATATARQAAVASVVTELRKQKPDGRIVLPIAYGAATLQSDFVLENFDHLYVPPRPKTVGVFGAVYQAASFQYADNTRVGDYLKLAGGARRHVSDTGQIFVIRANGSVISAAQIHDLANRPAYPGDVIYVPVRTGASTWEKVERIAAIVGQFGASAAVIGILAGR